MIADSSAGENEWLAVVSDVQDTVTSLQALQKHLHALNQQLLPVPGEGGVAGWEEGVGPAVRDVAKLVEEMKELDQAHSYLMWISHINTLRLRNSRQHVN